MFSNSMSTDLDWSWCNCHRQPKVIMIRCILSFYYYFIATQKMSLLSQLSGPSKRGPITVTLANNFHNEQRWTGVCENLAYSDMFYCGNKSLWHMCLCLMTCAWHSAFKLVAHIRSWLFILLIYGGLTHQMAPKSHEILISVFSKKDKGGC